MSVTVYLATNLVNGKRYIGFTKHSMLHRRKRHIYKAATGENKARFALALRKYGPQAFEWSVLCVTETVAEAKAKEIELIALLKPEYNVSAGGDTGPGEAWNKRQIICLNDGLIFPSAVSADKHYGLCQFSAAASCRLLTIAKGLHFSWYIKPLTEQERVGVIAERMKTRVQRRRQSNIMPLGRESPLVIDAKGRSAAGPMKGARAVICLDDAETYESASAAARAYGLPKSGIIELCLGKRGRKTIGGLRFRYSEVSHVDR